LSGREGGAVGNRGLEARGVRAIMRHRTQKVRKGSAEALVVVVIDNAITNSIVTIVDVRRGDDDEVRG
jgi:hypothetical protein